MISLNPGEVSSPSPCQSEVRKSLRHPEATEAVQSLNQDSLERETNASANQREVAVIAFDEGVASIRKDAEVRAETVFDSETDMALKQDIICIPWIIVIFHPVLEIIEVIAVDVIRVEGDADARETIYSKARLTERCPEEDVEGGGAHGVAFGIEERSFTPDAEPAGDEIVYSKAAAESVVTDEPFVAGTGHSILAKKVKLEFVGVVKGDRGRRRRDHRGHRRACYGSAAKAAKRGEEEEGVLHIEVAGSGLEWVVVFWSFSLSCGIRKEGGCRGRTARACLLQRSG